MPYSSKTTTPPVGILVVVFELTKTKREVKGRKKDRKQEEFQLPVPN
jgi:hypothetical protein